MTTIPVDAATLPAFPPRRETPPLDPPKLYSFFRQREPIARVRLWNGNAAWIVTRWEDVRTVLASPHASAVTSNPGFPTFSSARAAQLSVRKTFINMDPPEHSKYRRVLTKEFTIKRLEALRPAIQQVADQLLDAMIASGSPADLREGFAMPMPATIISTMLGVPYEHHDQLRAWTEQRNELNGDPEAVRSAANQMLALISDILRQKEAEPGDADLLSRMARDFILPGAITHDEGVQMASLLYAAGHDTSANQIALGMLSLLQDRAQFEAVRDDPAMLKPAIEEMLRFSTIVHFNSVRVATADIAVGDVTIKAGEGIFALLSAANRDPAVFEDPDAFDIFRPRHDHLAFSYGIHQCLGQPLARIELEIAFETILRRLPNLRLAVPADTLKFDEDTMVFHVKQLPVAW
ncbi:cytochrome P450 [Sphingomonas sp.]|uniref:cytochrome P450 n=1 Tax=Sphingomonas sp. TaxID=28214 RepID=UPI002DD669D3|nr:cytochrome P450 [Sphingomonas sp.]